MVTKYWLSVNRGDRIELIFLDDEGWQRFVTTLAEDCEAF